MSTPEQEYEEAVEIVAKRLFKIKYPAYVWEAIKKEEAQEFTEHARFLLRLTWPSGQPMIGVLSQDQEIPPLVHGQMPPVRSLIESGFRRVVEKR